MMGTMLPDADESHFPPTFGSSSPDHPRATSLEPPPDRCHRCSTTATLSLSFSLFPISSPPPSSHPRLSLNSASCRCLVPRLFCPLRNSVFLPAHYQRILYCLAVLGYEKIDRWFIGRSVGRNEERHFRVIDDVFVTKLPSRESTRETCARFVAPSLAALDHLNEVIVACLYGATRRFVSFSSLFFLFSYRSLEEAPQLEELGETR